MKFISRTLPVVSLLGLTGGLLGLVGSAMAQESYQNHTRSAQQQEAYVTVYKDCEFRGESRSLSVGDYLNMGSFDFDNDSISSIRVPPGLEVIIYKDDKFRGDYAHVAKDIFCFDKTWSDEVSSLRVSSNGRNASIYDNRRNTVSPQDSRNNQRRDERIYRGQNQNNQNQARGSEYQQNDRASNNRLNRNNQAGVNAKNVSQIIFANRVLQQVAEKQWQMVDSRSGLSYYKELSRDTNAVYLQNAHTAEKVRIDLFSNDVTFVKGNGQRNNYPVTAKSADSSYAGVRTNNVGPNRDISGRCFSYKAYTTGGAGGVRFHGHEGFTQFRSKAHNGRICHDDAALTMELNKTLPSTEVIIEIQGKKFSFGKNEKEDVFKNTWYRKKVTLNMQSR